MTAKLWIQRVCQSGRRLSRLRPGTLFGVWRETGTFIQSELVARYLSLSDALILEKVRIQISARFFRSRSSKNLTFIAPSVCSDEQDCRRRLLLSSLSFRL